MPPALLALLIARVERATRRRGERSALARELGVPRQRVNQWLRHGVAPSAEVALQLQNWVNDPARKQQKEPGRGATRPGRMTRTDKSTSNEKAKSDRRKR